jgi:hypothetical protein
MLTLSGLKKFYFLPNFHDMRCKAPRVAEIVRNKYHRDPLNQGCRKAQFFVTEVGKLYRRERLYKTKGLSVEQIKEMRNDSYAQGIIDRMKERMEKLLAEGEDQVSDLMWRALNYLHDFWDNLFAYRKDGEYAISRSNLFAWLVQ